MELAGGTKLLNKVTACKVNSSSGAEHLLCLLRPDKQPSNVKPTYGGLDHPYGGSAGLEATWSQKDRDCNKVTKVMTNLRIKQCEAFRHKGRWSGAS